MMDEIIGRETEIKQLSEYVDSDQPEFIAIYGRRRVGKTFLVTRLFQDRLAFDMTGVLNGDKADQMGSFMLSLKAAGYDGSKPKNWAEAFEILKVLLEKKLRQGRTIVFIDELPCLDTPRSGLVKALDLFWNGWGNRQNNLKLIVCGSATTWMIDNIIDNHGGLHNRITHEMHIHPFTLGETERFLQAKHFHWNRLTICQTYMIFGGIPYYLNLLNPEKGFTVNVDELFFSEDAPMRKEYDRLFASLFNNPQPYMKILQMLSTRKYGLTRLEIQEGIEASSGGYLSKMLENLRNCDFLRYYNVRDRKINVNNGIYQLVDFYVFFYNDFCRRGTTDEHFWTNSLNTPTQNNWYGLAFERLCMAHVSQIKQALGISAIRTEYYSWRSKTSKQKAQIDLIIERADQIINLCEIKYSRLPYVITAAEEDKLRNRIGDFVSETNVRQAVNLTFITTFGLKENQHSSEVATQLTMDALFR